MASVQKRDPRLAGIVADDVSIEKLGTGFRFTEGPVWHRQGKFLLFSDMPGDHMRRWSAADGVTTFRQPCNKSNGMAYDRQGRLLVCEHSTSRVTRTEADGSTSTLASHWQGKELNSPNDVVVAPDGSIVFTDPHYGRAGPPHGVLRPRFLDFQGVYRVVPGGEPVLLVDDFLTPNGLGFSPDRSQLYIIDSLRTHVRVFDVQADGGLAGGRVLFAQQEGELDLEYLLAHIAEHGHPPHGIADGMKVDEAGNIWVTGPEGIWVVGPDGERLGVVATPEFAANLVFGGPDGRTLYVTATHSVYRMATLVRGA